MRHIVCDLPRCTTLSTLSHKRHHFRKQIIKNKIRVLIFSTILWETFLIQRRTERCMIINVQWSSCKVHCIPFRFYSNLNILNIYFKNSQTSNFTKIRPVRAGLQHADRQDEAISRNYANAPKNVKTLSASFQILVLSTDIFVKNSLVSFGTVDFEQIKLSCVRYKVHLY